MTYVSWAIFCEGPTDIDYLSSLIPRVINCILSSDAQRIAEVPETPSAILKRGKNSEDSGRLICEAKDSFNILFAHGDTGGRILEGTLGNRLMSIIQAAGELCGFESRNCCFITPRNEIEAWCLADFDTLRLTLKISSDMLQKKWFAKSESGGRLARS